MIMGLASVSPSSRKPRVDFVQEGKTLKMISFAYFTVFGKQ